MSKQTRRVRWFTCAAAVLICACSSGDNLSGSYRVTEISALEHKLKVGEQTRIDLLFRTKLRPDETPAPVDVLVNLPPALSYVAASGRIYVGEALVESLRRDPDKVVECPDKSSFLRFTLADAELEPRGPDGDGSRQKLRIQIRATFPAQSEIQSSAGSREPFACGTRFKGERSEHILVE